MLQWTIRSAVIGSFFFISLFANAQPALNANDAKLKTKLHSVFPEMQVETVKPTPIPGLYEVSTGSTVFYTSEDGTHIVYGDMLFLKDKDNITNLTEAQRKIMRSKIIKGISDETTIIYPAKRPRYVLTVFTDTDCGYCRRFHQDIAELNKEGITVRYIAFPREGKNSATYKKMASIWCSKDRQKALTEAKSGVTIAEANCDHPIDKHLQIVEALDLKGTPTMLMSDGTMLPGYLPPKALLEQLQKVKADLN